MEAAWTRPRYPGYLNFQAEAGALIEQHLRGEMTGAALFDRIRRAFDASGRTDRQ
jgi:multiple sugar transport system substrate-binding protein